MVKKSLLSSVARLFIERRNRRFEYRSNLIQAATSDAVSASLVFLYLLKSNAQAFAQARLREAPDQSINANVSAYDFVCLAC